MAKNVAAYSINRSGGGNANGNRVTGGQGRGGNSRITRGDGPSTHVDMKAKTTGSDIKPSRTRPYDQGMHTSG